MTKMPDYIESQGNDYILTDFYPSSNVQKVEYKITMNESNTTKAYFGARSGNSNAAIVLWQVSGRIREDWANKNMSSTTVVNGTTYEGTMTPQVSSTFTSNSPLAVFSVNSNHEIDERMGKAKIYYIRMYNGSNTLLLDLIPWISEGRSCMKDRVSGSIYFSNSNRLTTGYDN